MPMLLFKSVSTVIIVSFLVSTISCVTTKNYRQDRKKFHLTLIHQNIVPYRLRSNLKMFKL